MKGIVVVGIVPVDRARRHKSFLVGDGGIGQRLDRRLAYLWIVEMQFAVFGDDVLAAIGDQEIVENVIRIVSVGGHVETEAIDIAHALGAQLLLHFLEEIVVGIPSLWNVLNLIAGLLDQRPPDVVRQRRGNIGRAVKAALFLDVVVAVGVEQRGLGIFLLLR